jgi:hypothetical protein
MHPLFQRWELRQILDRGALKTLSRNTGIDSVKENAPDAAIVEVTS